jgi:hypothetical protein
MCQFLTRNSYETRDVFSWMTYILQLLEYWGQNHGSQAACCYPEKF